MNVNCKLTLTDTERNEMYVHMTGKDTVLRMVTRKEVCEFVQGCIDAIVMGGTLDEPEVVSAPVVQYTAGEQSEIERLEAAGHCQSYINGQIQVYRRYGK